MKSCWLAIICLTSVNGFAFTANSLGSTRARFQTISLCALADCRSQRIAYIPLLSNCKSSLLTIRRSFRSRFNYLSANHRSFIHICRFRSVMSIAAGEWIPLGIPPLELRCDATLVCGQSFRWRKTADDEWSGVISGRLVRKKIPEYSVLIR
jgi:hypothetical protein